MLNLPNGPRSVRPRRRHPLRGKQHQSPAKRNRGRCTQLAHRHPRIALLTPTEGNRSNRQRIRFQPMEPTALEHGASRRGIGTRFQCLEFFIHFRSKHWNPLCLLRLATSKGWKKGKKPVGILIVINQMSVRRNRTQTVPRTLRGKQNTTGGHTGQQDAQPNETHAAFHASTVPQSSETEPISLPAIQRSKPSITRTAEDGSVKLAVPTATAVAPAMINSTASSGV